MGGSPISSLDVMLSRVIPPVRPLVSPKSSTSSPFLPAQSPNSLEESIMMELMLDMIYRKKKGMVTRTLSLGGEELESVDSLSSSEKGNMSRADRLRATVKDMLRRMPASLAPRKSVKSSPSKSSSAKQSLVS